MKLAEHTYKLKKYYILITPCTRLPHSQNARVLYMSPLGPFIINASFTNKFINSDPHHKDAMCRACEEAYEREKEAQAKSILSHLHKTN